MPNLVLYKAWPPYQTVTTSIPEHFRIRHLSPVMASGTYNSNAQPYTAQFRCLQFRGEAKAPSFSEQTQLNTTNPRPPSLQRYLYFLEEFRVNGISVWEWIIRVTLSSFLDVQSQLQVTVPFASLRGGRYRENPTSLRNHWNHIVVPRYLNEDIQKCTRSAAQPPGSLQGSFCSAGIEPISQHCGTATKMPCFTREPLDL